MRKYPAHEKHPIVWESWAKLINEYKEDRFLSSVFDKIYGHGYCYFDVSEKVIEEVESILKQYEIPFIVKSYDEHTWELELTY